MAVRPSGPRGQNGKPRQRSRADGDWALKSARQSVRTAAGMAVRPCGPRAGSGRWNKKIGKRMLHASVASFFCAKSALADDGCWNRRGRASGWHPFWQPAHVPHAVCGLHGDPYRLNRFARGEPGQIATRHWARAAEAAYGCPPSRPPCPPARADLAEEFEESQGDRAFPGIYGAGISQCEGCGRWGLQNKVGGTGGGRAIG